MAAVKLLPIRSCNKSDRVVHCFASCWLAVITHISLAHALWQCSGMAVSQTEMVL